MAEGIARFVQTAQMGAYTEQIGSFKETVKALQADNQEIDSLKAIVRSLQDSTEKSEADIAALQDHHHQEITRLQNAVKSLQESNEKYGADIAALRDQHHQEIGSLKASSAADITQLREEIAELRVQCHRAGGSPVYGGMRGPSNVLN